MLRQSAAGHRCGRAQEVTRLLSRQHLPQGNSGPAAWFHCCKETAIFSDHHALERIEHIIATVERLESYIMTVLEDLQTSTAALVQKVGSLEALTNSLKSQLDALANSGGATADQLNALKAQIDSAAQTVDATISADTPAAPALDDAAPTAADAPAA